jgi:hypothetical protein
VNAAAPSSSQSIQLTHLQKSQALLVEAPGRIAREQAASLGQCCRMTLDGPPPQSGSPSCCWSGSWVGTPLCQRSTGTPALSC